MIPEILWESSSLLLTLIGVLHLRGTLFTDLLHPINKRLTEEMKVSQIKVDPKAIIWKAWIGFNATFSVCLICMGLVNFYLAYKYFDILKGFSVISIITIGCTISLSWIAHRLLIGKVMRMFLITTTLFIIALFSSL